MLGILRSILNNNGAKSTFFVEYSRIDSVTGRSQLQAHVNSGHEIAVHGADPEIHHLSYAITDNLAEKLKEMVAIIDDATGTLPRFVRPPGGEKTLETNIEHGKVTSPAINGDKSGSVPVPSGLTINHIKNAYSAAGLTNHLKSGTSGGNSWLVELKSETFGSTTSTIASKMDEAVANSKTEDVIVLLHDVGGESDFIESNLGTFISTLNSLAADRKLKIEFVTMSNLVDEIE